MARRGTCVKDKRESNGEVGVIVCHWLGRTRC